MENNKQPLTKLSLNNKIVEMRKYVKQSRIHCINKLCKEIKKLKNSRGTVELKAKKLKKSENLIQQVLIMKKVNADDVTKFALLNDKPATQVLNDVNESFERKVMVRLASHKQMAEKIKQFEEAFFYTRNTLQLFLETLGEKYKNKKSKKRYATSSSNSPRGTKAGDEKLIFANKKEDKTRTNVNCDDDTDDQKNLLNVKKSADNLVHEERPPEIIDEELVKNFKTACKTKIKKKHPGTEPRNVIRSPDATVNDTINESRLVEMKGVARVADPFFTTKDNNEYFSISMKESVDTLAPDNKINLSDRFSNSYENNYQLNYEKAKHKSNRNGSNFTKSDRKVKLKSSEFKYNELNGSKEDSLPIHPSWEAKRKLRSIVPSSQFKGKKIKFNE